MKNRPVRVILGTSGVLLLLQLAEGLPFALNVTPSIPRGLYWRTGRKPHQGEYVAACLTTGDALRMGIERGYFIRSRSCDSGAAPLLKVLAAKRGNAVRWQSDGVWIDGVRWPDSTPQAKDPSGRPMPTVKGEKVLLPGEVVLLGESEASYDGRYFGEVVPSSVEALEMIITWEVLKDLVTALKALVAW